MTAPAPPTSAPHAAVEPSSDPREAALRERYAPGWKLASELPPLAVVLKVLGAAMFALFGLAFLFGLMEPLRSLSEQIFFGVAAPMMALGGVVVFALGFLLRMMAYSLTANTDAAFYAAKRDQGL